MKNYWVWKTIKEMKKTKFTWGVGSIGRDEKKDKNKRKRMLKCGVRVGKKKKGCNWDMKLERREKREGKE